MCPGACGKFQSKAQQGFMFKEHPKIAEKMAKATNRGSKGKATNIQKLPEKVD
jgi:hypothetical protein